VEGFAGVHEFDREFHRFALKAASDGLLEGADGYVSFKGPTTYRTFVGRDALTLPFRRSIEIQRTQCRFGPAVGSNPDGLGRKFKLADSWMIS
jgi:hypothetical protein